MQGMADAPMRKNAAGGGRSTVYSFERDQLTGLYNRQGFDHAVRTLIDSHPDVPFTILYGDIDRFKVFNDRFGTEAGDRLLAAIGNKVAAILPPDSVAARLRADHYVCCMPRDQCDPECAVSLLDAWFSTYPMPFAFFVRMGVYNIEDPSMDVSLMTDRALLALHKAKAGAQSSKYASFDESLHDSVVREQELAGEMKEALETGQFELFFQPQYRFSTKHMVGAEVLARWRHPEKGLISPAEFIPVFERTGLISTLDYYMWAEACRCLRTWLDEAGPGNEARVPHLSVNLSRADIYRADLCDYLVKLIEEYKIPSDLLHLEITESAYVEAPEQLTETVTFLQEAGFTVEMDDFGSGYSSLNALKDVPVDVLKLDLRFLDARNDTRGGIILASVVRMARWLDVPVIAEGVESESQALFLSSIGCDMMQGFWFSRPMDRASFEQLLEREEQGSLVTDGLQHSPEDYARFWDAESLVALLFNNYVGPAAVAEYDGSHFEVVRANDEFSSVLHLQADQFARTLPEVFGDLSGADRERLDEALEKALGGTAHGECELRVRGRGQDFWVRASIRVLARTGAVSSLLVMLDEITETQILRDRLHGAMDGVPGGLVFYRIDDGNPMLLDFNDATAEFAGLTRDEYEEQCEKDPFALVLEDDRWTAAGIIEDLRAGASRSEGLVRVVHADGSLRWMSLFASLTHRTEHSMYLVVAMQDVTKDKERDLSYRHLAEQQQQLYESIPCGVVRYTAEETPRFESANRTAWRILGCSTHQEMLAYVSGDPYRPLDQGARDGMQRVTQRLLDGEPSVSFSIDIARKDGSTCSIEGMAALATTSDGTIIVQSAFNDVTAQRLERNKRELQKFASVLYSAYDEVFEYDVVDQTFLLHYSSRRLAENARPAPIEHALDRWLCHVVSSDDRQAIRSIFDRCRREPLEEPLSITYRCEINGATVWNQSTFLRVSESSVLCCNNDVSDRMDAEDARLTERVSDIVENLPAGIAVYDLDDDGLHLRFISDTLYALMDVELHDDEAIMSCSAIVALEDAKSFLAQYDDHWSNFTVEREIERKSGSFVARVQGRTVLQESGTVRIYAVVTDISDEVRERNESAWQNERYRILSELTHTISFDYSSNSDTVLLYIDRTGNGMEAQVIPNYLQTLSETRTGVVHPSSIDTVRAMFEHARAGAKGEIIEYRADYYGTGYQWYRANLFVAHDESGAWHLVGLIENIQSERELRLLAEHDAVTGLSNNASTRNLIDSALADPHVCAHSVCAVIDLDDFKNVNDTFGHLKGDELLQQVGSLLRSSCRECDVVGRVGGDEFVAFLKNINLDVAARKLVGIKRNVEQLVVYDDAGACLRPSLSIGATPTCADDVTYSDVFSRADKALYQAKRAGKNRLRITR